MEKLRRTLVQNLFHSFFASNFIRLRLKQYRPEHASICVLRSPPKKDYGS